MVDGGCRRGCGVGGSAVDKLAERGYRGCGRLVARVTGWSWRVLRSERWSVRLPNEKLAAEKRGLKKFI